MSELNQCVLEEFDPLVHFKEEDDYDYLVEDSSSSSASETENSEAQIELLSPEFFAAFLKDVEDLARKTIHKYFDRRKMSCGGPIRGNLDSPEYVTQLLNTDICDGTDRAYEAMNQNNAYNEMGDDDESLVSNDIKMYIALLHSVEAVVPRAFVAGIVLMHLELVEGLEMS